MRIGIPKEVHEGERRVATTPEVVEQLKKLGFVLTVQRGAGEAACFTNAAYEQAGRPPALGQLGHHPEGPRAATAS